MVEVRDVLGDPKFHQLPPEERRKVLGAIDPNFSGLPPLEQDKVLGIVAEPEPGQRGVAPWKIWTSRLARPVLEGGGLLAGGAVGATTGPVGAVAGGALGYGMGKKGSDLVDAALGLEVPTLEEGIKETPGLIAKGAAMEVGGQIAGKAIGAGAGLIAKGGQQVIGKLTGAGPGAIEEAAKATPAFRKAMRGKVSGDEIVESAKGALQTVKDARGAAYQKELAEITEDGTVIDMTPIRQKIAELAKRYNVNINEKGEIDVARIAMGKRGREDIKDMIEEVSEWGVREGDDTAVGLDILKRQLDDFYSDSSQARGFVTALRTAVKETIDDAVPQYKQMTKGYEDTTKMIKDFETGLMLRKRGMTGRVTGDMTLRRLMSSMRENSGLRKELLDSLSESGGKELSQMTAGYTLKGLMPIGLAGTGPAIIGEVALAKLVHPGFWPALAMSSPRVAGEFVQFMGRLSAEAAGTAGLAGTLGVYGAGKDIQVPTPNTEEVESLLNGVAAAFPALMPERYFTQLGISPEEFKRFRKEHPGMVHPAVYGDAVMTAMDLMMPGAVLTRAPKGLEITKKAGTLSAKRTVRPHFAKNLDAPSNAYMNWVNLQRNKITVHPNQKTGLSIDFCTTCPRRSQGFGACPYCYVQHSREAKKLGMGFMHGKAEVDNVYKHELLYMPPKLVTELNRDGGIRMFSFGDFRPGIDSPNVGGALADAGEKGLYIKAITKQKELIDEFGGHPNLRANISVDWLPREMSNSPTTTEALQWKGNKQNVKVRSVALNEEQARMMSADPRIDVVTLYHGPTGERLMKIIEAQNPDLIKRLGRERVWKEISTWQNMTPKSKIAQEVQSKYKGKICCAGGKCSRDPTKCGFGIGSLIVGLHVPEWFGESPNAP